MKFSPFGLRANALCVSRWSWVCLAFLVVGFLFSLITPPFQSPDEVDHVGRAYMFGHGQWVLHPLGRLGSGGGIDDGLAAYMKQFHGFWGHPGRKVVASDITSDGAIQWAGTTSLYAPAGTGYSFPLLYTPQALSLVVGEALGWTIDQSYHLARLLNLAVCVGLLLLAFRLFPPPASVVALLFLPMNLFLFASATFDGIVLSMFIVLMSAFMRICVSAKASSSAIEAIFFLSLALVVSSKANLIVFLLLPFVVFTRTRKKWHLAGAIIVSLLTVGWTAWMVSSVTFPVLQNAVDRSGRLGFYLVHPLHFVQMLVTTLSDAQTQYNYWASFLGVLGYLDAGLKRSEYILLSSIFGFAILASWRVRPWNNHPYLRLVLLVCAVGTLLMTFLALLVQWTAPGSAIIQGVQGRYFSAIFVGLAYALLAREDDSPGFFRSFGTVTVWVLAIASTTFTLQLLLSRYYVSELYVRHDDLADSSVLVTPSRPLKLFEPIPVRFPKKQLQAAEGIDRLSIRLATYATGHSGRAYLRLWTASRHTFTTGFELSAVGDGELFEFTLDGAKYIGGEIVSEGGEGISTWEAAEGQAPPITCMLVREVNNSAYMPHGCSWP